MIDVKHLSKSFGDHLVLDDIDQHIYPGEKVVIIGPSGSGKSTFLRCLNLLEEPSAGTITFNGTVITDPKVDIDAVRRQMGMVFQHFNLFPNMTIRRNITLAPVRTKLMSQAEADDTATALLRRVGLEEKADAYPAQLSGGQKQRIAIARTLATDPKVLLCDEATSALDPKTTRDILRLIRDINHRLGITVVIITHDMKVIEEICTHVAILDHGHLVEKGSVEAVFSRPQSEAGRRLVYPDGVPLELLPEGRVIRVAFNGGTAYQPLIASMAKDLGVLVNILGADTRNIDGKAFGTMLLGLPEDPIQAQKAVNYIASQKNITMEEVRDYHAGIAD